MGSDLLTPAQIAEIAEREAKATEGPWEWVGPDVPWSKSTPIHTRGKKKGQPLRRVRDSYPIMLACPEGDGRIDWHDRGVFKVFWPSRKGEVIHTFKSKHDLGFIASARADIPRLLSHAAAQAARIEELQGIAVAHKALRVEFNCNAEYLRLTRLEVARLKNALELSLAGYDATHPTIKAALERTTP